MHESAIPQPAQQRYGVTSAFIRRLFRALIFLRNLVQLGMQQRARQSRGSHVSFSGVQAGDHPANAHHKYRSRTTAAV
jgi:hypothetical protein